MVEIIDQLHEAVLRVEGPCIFVDCVNFNRTHAYLIRNMLCSSQGIDEQQLPQSLPLSQPVYGEPAEQNYWDIDVRQSLCLFARESFTKDSMVGDGVVAQHCCVALLGRHIGACQVTLFKLGGTQLEPVVETQLTAIERGPSVPVRKARSPSRSASYYLNRFL